MPAAEKQSRSCWNNVVVHCVCIITCLFIAVIVSKYFLYSDAGSNHVKTFGGFNSTDICKENLALVFKKQGKNMPLSPVIVSRGLLLLLPEL